MRDVRRSAAEPQVDAVGAQGGGQCLAERPRLTWQQMVHALDDRRLRAQAVERLGHLDADRSAAEHDDALGHLLQAGGLPVGPNAVEVTQAVDRRDHGFRAGREDDLARPECRVADRDGAGPADRPGPAVQVDAVVGEPARLRRVVVVGDHEVAPGERLLDVDRARDRLAGSRGGERAGDGFAGAQQCLGGDAGPVRALSGDELALDDRHPQAAGGKPGGAVLTGRPCPDQHDVVGVASHVGSIVLCLHDQESP